MKKSLAIFFLLLYFIVLLKPIYPFIEYAINKDYIAKVLCINQDKPEMQCHGKCHLEKQLKKASEEENKPKQNTPPKIENKENLFIHSIEEWKEIVMNEDIKVNNFKTFTFISQLLAEPPTPPPKSFHC